MKKRNKKKNNNKYFLNPYLHSWINIEFVGIDSDEVCAEV